MKIVILIIVLAVAFTFPACTANVGDSSNGDPDTLLIRDLAVKPNPHLGLAFPGPDPDYFHLMSEVGIGVVRLPVPWSKREPKPGVFKWEKLDKMVLRLQHLGIEPFLTMDTDAKWGIVSSKKRAKNRPPSDLRIWQRFVGALVERYDADGIDDAPGLLRPVRYYQAANEWVSDKNRSGGWSGTTDEFIQFINGTHDAAKASYPEALFVMGGIAALNLDAMVLSEGLASYTARSKNNEKSGVTLTPERARSAQLRPHLESAYRVLRNCRFDMVDVHLYGPVTFNEHRISLIENKCPDYPVLSSECGGPSLDYDDDITPDDHFMAVMEINLHLLARGLEFGLWFRLGESPHSTWGNAQVPLYNKSLQPKAGYWAYQLLAAVLEGVESVQRLDDGMYLVHRPGGSSMFVAWKTDEHTTSTLPPEVEATHLLRITSAGRGGYSIEAVPENGVLTLGNLPVVAGAVLPGEAK